MIKRKMGGNRRMTREEKAAEEMEWRKINEEIELEAEGIEPLMDSYSVYSNEVTAMFCMPILTYFLMEFRLETKIPENYSIRETDLRFISFSIFTLYFIPWFWMSSC